ncbi:RNA exonuclease 4 isoform X2 [Formica exsecta]|uniref:RNA exonuclease 4 isoform X2 n=1 Tax=Formica exsecta TaxID=72781 RepID=UPI0011444117|nr:RNA exonuclease 4 isoform X2 [Formica exsecta]
MNNNIIMNNVSTGMGTKKKNKTTKQLASNTERKASGSNWEMYKNLFSKPNIEEGHAPQNRHSKSKKVHVTLLHTNRLEENTEYNDVKNKENKTLTKHIAMDCEMVGIGDGTESMLARISIVNKHGFCLYDKYVKPREKVVDYRTAVSGIRPEQLQNGEDFNIVQKEVADMLKGRILVGHALKHDLNVLFLSHPRRYWRDTSKYKPFRQISKGNTPSLKKLAHELLGREIQVGEHSSVEDARAAMQLYMLYKNKWESEKKGRW